MERRYVQAKTHRQAEEWEEDTPTGCRVPRKLTNIRHKTQRSKDNG